MESGGLRLIQEHDLRLIAVAVFICLIGCFSTVNLMMRARQSPARQAAIWLPGTAAVFAITIWSTHFLAMLAFHCGMPIDYDVTQTLESVVIAGLGTLLGLIAWYVAPLWWLGVLCGGALLGLAIGGMHYSGVNAMRMAGQMNFDPLIVAASVVMGIAFSCLAMTRFEPNSGFLRRVEMALWLTLSICGLHFTGMSALHIMPAAITPDHTVMLGSGMLAVAVASVSLAVLIVCLAVTLMEQHLAARAAAEHQRLQLMNNLAREALVIHRHGAILEVNQAAGQMLGMPAATLAGQPLFLLFAPENAPALLNRLRQDSMDVWPEEVQVVTAEGQYIPVELASQSIPYRGARANMVILRDLTDKKRNEARIRYLAHHDMLTELPSRTLLQEFLQTALKAAAQRGIGAGAGVMYLDLDRFKPVNDLLGHAGGDAVLVEVARRLRAQIRSADAIARLGGDEFVIVLADVRSAEEVHVFAARLIKTLEEPIYYDGQQVSIGVSIGAALYPRDGLDSETLLRAADMAMYQAKASGRGGLAFFEARMDVTLRERNRLEQELQGALQRDELLLHYQPLVDCRTGRVDGYEALLRWQHPERGLMNASQFIPIAEASGLIKKIDNWVIEHACADAATWMAPLRVAVNISPSRFRQTDLPGVVADALARSGLAPGRLELEVTESMLITDADSAIQLLSKLRGHGVVLSLDDFGTGYSSLSYLRLFRFHKIKIDQSFVRELRQSEEAATIVSAIVKLGHTLGLSVTVEGVETRPQLAQLLALGADQLQGYLFGRPGPMETFDDVFQARVAGLIRRAGGSAVDDALTAEAEAITG
jgi:diguanylate cyclase (GGDEF)-like protein/PAS domain S-box-containing protein